MAKRVFIIHGWEGAPDSNWFPWLRSKLEGRGMEVHVPQMPDSYNPKQGPWLEALAALVGRADEETYFVGHSLGCITILRYLESMREGSRIGGAVFVAGFTDDLGIKEIGDFFKAPIDYAKISEGCGRFVAIASDNDKYVALKYSDILKDNLNAKIIVEPGMGHFNMKELHVVLNELLKMMAPKA